MTPYMIVCNEISRCRTLGNLQRVWHKYQSDINSMDQTPRSWLVAMKDYYKGMIQRGEIDAYLSVRNAAAEKNKIQEQADQVDRRMVRQ